jgi:hypothetical protein
MMFLHLQEFSREALGHLSHQNLILVLHDLGGGHWVEAARKSVGTMALGARGGGVFAGACHKYEF